MSCTIQHFPKHKKVQVQIHFFLLKLILNQFFHPIIENIDGKIISFLTFREKMYVLFTMQTAKFFFGFGPRE